MSNVTLLDPRLQRWLWQQGWDSLRPVQENALKDVLGADRDVVIAAPTAGGKTEAAWLPILSSLASRPVSGGFGVLALSPLKALINDQTRRLDSMAASVGVAVTPWHGDVARSSKRTALDAPEGVLMITPESLEALFVHRPEALQRAFGALRYIVVDELHAFMGTERGKQLQSLMARVEALAPGPVARIALSATFADTADAAAFLRPRRGAFPFSVPDNGGASHDTLVLLKEFAAVDDSCQFIDATAAELYRRLRGTNNLVFTNSRKEAEALALRLRDLSDRNGVPDEFFLHHGSLSRPDRHAVEQALKDGGRPLTAICTSTLELGVDIGSVSSIAQIETADSVSALRQRLGRSGRRGEPSVLRIYSRDEERDDYKYRLRTNLVQNIAVVELLRRGLYEKPDTDAPHYSTLIQQLLSLTAQYGSFHPADAWTALCRDGAFADVSPDDFMALLRALGAKNVLAQGSGGQIVIGAEGERIVGAADFCTAFTTLPDLNVVDKSSGRSVGAVQYKPYVGEYILLAAQRWLVEAVDDRSLTVRVSPAHTTGKMMFEGYGREVDGMITRRMRDIYLAGDVYPYLDSASGAPAHLEAARRAFRDMGLDSGAEADVDGTRLLFTWGGMRLNRTLALMARAEGRPLPAFDPYAVEGLDASLLRRLEQGEVDTVALASLISRGRKLLGKHDHLLPDTLLDRQYAARRLAPVPKS